MYRTLFLKNVGIYIYFRICSPRDATIIFCLDFNLNKNSLVPGKKSCSKIYVSGNHNHLRYCYYFYQLIVVETPS